MNIYLRELTRLNYQKHNFELTNMKKILVFLFISANFLNAQTKLYVHPMVKNMSETLNHSNSSLILKASPQAIKRFTSEQIEEMEKNEALDIQRDAYMVSNEKKKR